MFDDTYGDTPLPGVFPRLIARYGPDLVPERVTPYKAASAVGVALRQPEGSCVPAVDALAALSLVPDARRQLDHLEAALIEAVLDRGVTWEQLGMEYGGRTRQTVQQLYRRRGGTRTWEPGRFPALSSTGVDDDTGTVVSQAVTEVAGTWEVHLRRGCRPGEHVVREVLPVLLRLEHLRVDLVRRPFPEWLARDRSLPRRVRSAVRSFERTRDTGSTVVLRAVADGATGSETAVAQ